MKNTKFTVNQILKLNVQILGLVDEKEYELIQLAMEEKLKRLWSSPASITPLPPSTLLANLNWVAHREDLMKFIKVLKNSKEFHTFITK